MLRLFFGVPLAVLIGFIVIMMLSACASSLPPPTSERLESVRTERGPNLIASVNEAGFAWGAPLFIRIFKEEGELEAWLYDQDSERFRLYRTYPICKFSGDLGPKLAEGDHQSPEGFYNVKTDQLNPWSQFHLSFNIGFPNEYDAAWGRSGSLLMVHGQCTSEGCYAMTDPVIEEIYLLTEAALQPHEPSYAPYLSGVSVLASGGSSSRVSGGIGLSLPVASPSKPAYQPSHVPVHIFPFRMTSANMLRHTSSRWHPFWQNLKEGHDAFEAERIPPKVSVRDYTPSGHYAPSYVFTSGKRRTYF